MISPTQSRRAAAIVCVGQGDFRYRASTDLGAASRRLELRRSGGRGHRLGRQRARLQSRRASGHRVRSRTANSCARGAKGCSPGRTASRSDPTTASTASTTSDHTVRKFTPEGRLLLTLGHQRQTVGHRGARPSTIARSSEPAAPFNFPTNLALAPDGEMYVADGYGNARVHRFSPDGQLIASWGEPGAGPGQFPRAARHRGRSRMARCTSPIARTAACSCFSPDGEFLDRVDRRGPALPGARSTPNDHVFVAELGYRAGMFPGNEPPPGQTTGGRVSIFDRDGRVAGPLGRRRQSLRRRRFLRSARSSGSIAAATSTSARSPCRPAAIAAWSSELSHAAKIRPHSASRKPHENRTRPPQADLRPPSLPPPAAIRTKPNASATT